MLKLWLSSLIILSLNILIFIHLRLPSREKLIEIKLGCSGLLNLMAWFNGNPWQKHLGYYLVVSWFMGKDIIKIKPNSNQINLTGTTFYSLFLYRYFYY